MYVHLPSLLHFSTEIIPDPPPILNPRILEINRHVAEEGGGVLSLTSLNDFFLQLLKNPENPNPCTCSGGGGGCGGGYYNLYNLNFNFQYQFLSFSLQFFLHPP